MKKYQIDIPWDVEKENAEIFVKSMAIAFDMELPAEVEAESPSSVYHFLISE
ncbi:hypothetical protein [Paenibacillus maysiensis]|uniref:hypothetical protein n=1 Tax=Paenibacillus maysiensis TaxID=1155954 RepID=UPI0004BA3F74|nr:hypothetical protein [Paenibacillus maysiensis]